MRYKVYSLYLFLDITENDILNSEINVERIKLNNKTYIWVIVPEFNIKYLNSVKENLTSKKRFASIAWIDNKKSILYQEIILPYKNKEKFKKYKVALPNWLLFYWPPWCWKTYISSKLAEELWWNFMEIKHSDVSSPYIHWWVWKIWQIFEKAKLKSPIVLFFDEISWLAQKRENISEHSSHKEEEINELLIHLKKKKKNWILVVWATNFPNKLDSAISRTWRFDLKIFLWPPNKETRISLFNFYLNGRPIENDIDYDKLWDLTENYIISDIEFIIESTAKKAAIKDVLISQSLLEKTIKWISPSISKEELLFFQRIAWKWEHKENKIWFNLN